MRDMLTQLSPPASRRSPCAAVDKPGAATGGRHGQRGQTVPLLVLLVALAGLVAVGLVEVAGAAARRASAEAAADATALAGAADGPDAARRVATANGARVVVYNETGVDVAVTVVRRGVRASARARWEVAARSATGKRRAPVAEDEARASVESRPPEVTTAP